MPVTINPIPALQDNYIWLLQTPEQTVCIDPGDAAVVCGYLKPRRLALSQIWLTHHHADHTGGVAELQRHYPDCQVYGPPGISGVTHAVAEGNRLSLAEADDTLVWAVPGHTDSHLAYVWTHQGQTHVFCGDTLFSAGCGRVFTGTLPQLYHSLQRLNRLPPDTLLYPTHEYTAANLRFAAHIEPDNPDIAAAQQQLSVPSLPVTLAHEQRINPFLRTHLPHLHTRAADWLGHPPADDLAVFAALREWKKRF